jgi:hypothetical protein
MVRTGICGIALLAITSFSYSQDEIYKGANTIEGSATIAPSWMLNRGESNYYIMAYGEYHFSEKLSLRSDNFFFVDSDAEVPFFDDAFRSYFGVFVHDQKGNWDKYIGFQPGISLLRKNPYSDGIQPFSPLPDEPLSVVPSLSLTVGTSFYVWKYFNFFANLSYVNSTMGGISGGPHRTDELILSAGLSFQVKVKKDN